MAEPFIAEIKIFAGNFAPRSYAFCDGQLLPIAQNTALFSLIGTTYGGDGRTTMALPNLQGRAPMHPGRGPGLTARRLGEKLGIEAVTLVESQIPSHYHTLRGSTAFSDSTTPGSNTLLGRVGGDARLYNNTASPNADLASQSLQTTGGSQSHENMQPFITLNFIIALYGLYPSRG